jgi:hypothetical protein
MISENTGTLTRFGIGIIIFPIYCGEYTFASINGQLFTAVAHHSDHFMYEYYMVSKEENISGCKSLYAL